jgi:hypothetical protein
MIPFTDIDTFSLFLGIDGGGCGSTFHDLRAELVRGQVRGCGSKDVEELLTESRMTHTHVDSLTVYAFSMMHVFASVP